nr:hypothetical protein [Spiroplasma mirum]
MKNVMKEIERTYCKGAVMKLGDKSHLKIEAVSIGSLVLDNAIGIGGYPKERGGLLNFWSWIIGKNNLIFIWYAIAEVQKLNVKAAFIDTDQALDILETLLKLTVIDIVVIDSVAALVPKVELEGEMSDVTVDAQAHLMSKALRKLNGVISKTNCIVIFINQICEKVWVMSGNPETTAAGGRALRFYSSVRLEVRRAETLTNSGVAIANKVKIKVVKNKVAPPFKVASIDINYNEGIDKYTELIDLAVNYSLTIFIILLMGIIKLKDNPLKLIQPNSNLSSENKITHLLKRIHFKKFTSRFKVILLSVSLKNIGLLFIVLLLATVGLTGAIIIPTSLKQVSQDYYKNLSYNNETNYNGIIGNKPLMRYQLYNWAGPDSAESEDAAYPIRNNNVFSNYIKKYLYDKDGNTLDENGNIVLIGNAKKYRLDIWNLPQAAIKYYEDDLRNAVLYNFATARGAALSLGIFKALSNHYLDDDLNYTISTLLCTVVPTAFGKEPIPFDNTRPYESWLYCFSVATESILSPDIKQIWNGNEQR